MALATRETALQAMSAQTFLPCTARISHRGACLEPLAK
jgi:hypothetical protein